MLIYSRAFCPPCIALKKYLTHKGVAFVEKNIDEAENLKELMELTGVILLPTVVKGDKIIMGLNYGAVAKLI